MNNKIVISPEQVECLLPLISKFGTITDVLTARDIFEESIKQKSGFQGECARNAALGNVLRIGYIMGKRAERARRSHDRRREEEQLHRVPLTRKSPLSGEFLRAFTKYADEGGNVPIRNIMPFAAEIVDIAARELGGSLDLCGIAYSVGITKIVMNQHVDILQPNEHGVILEYTDERIICIVLDEKLSRQERHFALAHEIGHYVLHVRNNGRGGFNFNSNPQMDNEANMFAGALLYSIDQHRQTAATV